MSNAYFQAAMSEYLAEEARATDMTPEDPGDVDPFTRAILEHSTGELLGVAPGEGLAALMFGNALEPDPDYACGGVETDYPGGPLVIEKSGADAAVRAVEKEQHERVSRGIHRAALALAHDSLADWQRRTRRTERCDKHGVVYRPGEACGLCYDAALHDSGILYDEPAADLSAITRDIARGA